MSRLASARDTRGHRLRIAIAAIAAVLLALVLAAAFVPIAVESREAHYEIPKGTWARRHQGLDVQILPARIELVAGVRDMLVLENRDDVPQMFGPTLLMPGQSLRLPFAVPSENVFACSAHASGQMVVVLEEGPTTPWRRLVWRVSSLLGGG
ncbi:MAG: hypothetical protein NT062_34750 [Proteobacteria bacterium]|nr:hypothetical protein [Pseudomonadota bacterium]